MYKDKSKQNESNQKQFLKKNQSSNFIIPV